MNYDFDTLSKAEVYRLLTHTVVPRPIAWVLTENEAGGYNVAPFSYFNVVASSPALLMFSVGHKRDGSEKDTRYFLQKNKRCVVHIANSQQIDLVNESAKSLAANESEVELLDLALTAEAGFALPRIASSPIAFDCSLYDVHLLGEDEQAVMYLKVEQAFVADDLVNAEQPLIVDAQKLKPLARLGGENYASLGEIKTRKRPS